MLLRGRSFRVEISAGRLHQATHLIKPLIIPIDVMKGSQRTSGRDSKDYPTVFRSTRWVTP